MKYLEEAKSKSLPPNRSIQLPDNLVVEDFKETTEINLVVKPR